MRDPEPPGRVKGAGTGHTSRPALAATPSLSWSAGLLWVESGQGSGEGVITLVVSLLWKLNASVHQAGN